MDNAKKNVKIMLKKRGYTLVEENDNVFLLKKNKNKLLLFFNPLPKLNIQIMKEFLSFLQQQQINHGIIVYKVSTTSQARKIISNLFNIKIELFSLQELQFDITTHRYYRPHIKLNEDEKKDFLSNFGGKIPFLLKTDPIVRYFNFEKGDIIKVIRKDNYISYRIVK